MAAAAPEHFKYGGYMRQRSSEFLREWKGRGREQVGQKLARDSEMQDRDHYPRMGVTLHSTAAERCARARTYGPNSPPKTIGAEFAMPAEESVSAHLAIYSDVANWTVPCDQIRPARPQGSNFG